MKYADTPPRKKVGDCDFDCPNCNRELHRTLWREQDKDDLECGFVHADAKCRCGAHILVADDLESFKVFWLNEKDMKNYLKGRFLEKT